MFKERVRAETFMNNAGWASGGLQAIEPIVGVALGMGDREHADFCLEFRKHECIGNRGSKARRISRSTAVFAGLGNDRGRD